MNLLIVIVSSSVRIFVVTLSVNVGTELTRWYFMFYTFNEDAVCE